MQPTETTESKSASGGKRPRHTTSARSAKRPSGARLRKLTSAAVSTPTPTRIEIFGIETKRSIKRLRTVEITYTPLTEIPEDAQVMAYRIKGIRLLRSFADVQSIVLTLFRSFKPFQFPKSVIVTAEYTTGELKVRMDPIFRVTARVVGVREIEAKEAA